MNPDGEEEIGGVTEAESQKVEPVFGIDESMSEIMGDVALDTSELVEGGLSDCNVTLIGFNFERGGETRPSKDNPEETYQTKDRVLVHMRIDNTDEIGWDKDPYTYQGFNMPAARQGKDGQTRRAKLNRNSTWGMWLSILEGLGVSTREADAKTYRFTSFDDLIGLQYHRVRNSYELGWGDRTMDLNAPVEILGIDNDYRKEKGLPPKYLVGQEPAPAAAAKK